MKSKFFEKLRIYRKIMIASECAKYKNIKESEEFY